MALPNTGINAKLNGTMVFSPLSEWNIRIDHASLADNSSKIISAISPNSSLRPDFGSGSWQGKGIGMPYIVVDKGGAGVPIAHHWPDEADAGPYPIPNDAPIEGGGDHHVIVLERDPSAWNGLGNLYEIWDAKRTESGWTGQGAVFDMAQGDLQRPEGWTSADAAGLPVFPGLARHDEMERAIAEDGENGVIPHALRFTLQDSLIAKAFIGAASHYAGGSSGVAPFGMHVRLKASYQPPDDMSVEAKVLVNTLKQYGMILADIGSNWYISGTHDAGWDDDALRDLMQTHGRDFEVVDLSKPLQMTGGDVAEGSPSGETLFDVTTLADVPEGASVTYRLVDGAGGRFALKGENILVDDGLLLDYESDTAHTAVVRATDQAGMSVDYAITFQVQDVAEEARSVGAESDIASGAGFWKGVEAENGSGRIIRNPVEGAGSSEQALFAALDRGLKVTSTDFDVL